MPLLGTRPTSFCISGHRLTAGHRIFSGHFRPLTGRFQFHRTKYPVKKGKKRSSDLSTFFFVGLSSELRAKCDLHIVQLTRLHRSLRRRLHHNYNLLDPPVATRLLQSIHTFNLWYMVSTSHLNRWVELQCSCSLLRGRCHLLFFTLSLTRNADSLLECLLESEREIQRTCRRAKKSVV